ncbi:undecaprenyl-phosphate glucose phosphotransferase [Alsobacter soli]|uniref:Undecaprenyl-phosphate glucose phosphotransferase n=1 Tax=Alsobacter soli TaxID=2109933 RepID=A0A2T1HNB9_9HYPH|nr:undecaprenyl-phosphate glucose phosphotransferase [Alsobacter soli]PSC03127.1 undecaprenyl-phosphate glucose phosphotransferase [Alsobacter soli]
MDAAAKQAVASSGIEGARHWVAPLRFQSIGAVVATLDSMLILAAAYAGAEGYHLSVLGQGVASAPYLAIALATAALFGTAMHSRGLYEPRSLMRFYKQLASLTVIWGGVCCLLIVVGFALKFGASLSRGAVFCFMFGGYGLLVANRLAWRIGAERALERDAFRLRRVALLTIGEATQDEATRKLRSLGYDPVERRHIQTGADDAKLSEDLKAFAAELRGHPIEEVFVFASWDVLAAFNHHWHVLRALPLPVKLTPVGTAAAMLARPSTVLGHTVAFEVQRPPLSEWEQRQKRCLDCFVAAGGLLVLSPLLLLVALAIRLEGPGPVLFRQHRQGFNGAKFSILKFRSMLVLEDGAVIRQAQRGDPRITRVGAFIRRTSLDELPQLFNVLRGDMSLVGPRPHAVAHDNLYDAMIANYAKRWHVKPGLTGWAQVNGSRGETPTVESMEARVRYDLWYIDNWSLWLDLRILLRTGREVLRSQSAY